MADLWGSQSGGEMLGSPAPVNSGSTWQTGVPATQGGFTWADIMKLLASSGKGGGTPSVPFGNIGPQLAPQSGVPLYYMPQAAPLMDSDQQKQSSAGDIDQYAKILSALFL